MESISRTADTRNMDGPTTTNPSPFPPKLVGKDGGVALTIPPTSTAEIVNVKQTPQPWTHLLAGASAGFSTAIITSPFDVLRTRLQSDFYEASTTTPTNHKPFKFTPMNVLRASSGHIRDTVQILQSIRATEGWRGFYRGLGPSMAGVVPSTAIKFYVYGNSKRIAARMWNLPQDSALVHATAAISAGFVTSTATNPIWLVKTRLQLDKSRAEGNAAGASGRQYKNSIDCLRKVIRYEGIRGLYSGLTASYLGSIETALHLVLYEQLRIFYTKVFDTEKQKSSFAKEVSTWMGTSGAAGSAKLIAALLTYPHEVVRTRMRQAPMENGQPKYTGLVQCFRSIAHTEGMNGLYGGLTPHLARSVPSAIITLGVYEFVLRLFGN